MMSAPEPRQAVSPLTRGEERTAIKAARQRIAAERLYVYGAELHVTKRGDRPPLRQVRVVLADLGGYTPYEVLVDPEGGEVVDVRERSDLVPPFSSEEMRNALVLARSNGQIEEVANRPEVKPAMFYPIDHEHGSEHREHRRRVGIHYLDTSGPTAVPVADAVVDLTGGGIESFVIHPNPSAGSRQRA